MKVYWYQKFISSFDDHSNGNGNLTKGTSPVIEKELSYCGINFFANNDLKVLEVISRGEYITFGMQGKNIHQHLEKYQSISHFQDF